MNVMNSTNSTPTIGNNQCSLSADDITKSYNLTLHIVSVFVLFAVSLLGATISVASTRVKFLYINPIIINTGKFFGSGYVKI